MGHAWPFEQRRRWFEKAAVSWLKGLDPFSELAGRWSTLVSGSELISSRVTSCMFGGLNKFLHHVPGLVKKT